MRPRKIVLFGAAGLIIFAVIATLLGCAGMDTTDNWAKVCADTQQTEITRAADEKCEQRSTSEAYRWRYYTGGTRIPAVGKVLPKSVGTWDVPEDKFLWHIPPEGGWANKEAGK